MSLVLLCIVTFLGKSIANEAMDCPESQFIDSQSICRIFEGTNIQDIIPNNFSDINYCRWGYQYTLIGCNSDDDESINIIELQYQQGLNGTLNFDYLWPENLIELDLKQSASSDTNLYGEWNWSSMIILEDLIELDLEGNQV